MRRLPQEFSSLQIEYAFVSRRTIGAHDCVASSAAMGCGDAQQLGIARFARGIKNNRHVHHDIDEQRLRRDERLQILPFLHESHCQRAAGLK